MLPIVVAAAPELLKVTSPASTVVITLKLPPIVSGADCVTSPADVSDTLPATLSAPPTLMPPLEMTVRFWPMAEAPMSVAAASVTCTLPPFSTRVPKVLPALLSVMLCVPALSVTGASPRFQAAVPCWSMSCVFTRLTAEGVPLMATAPNALVPLARVIALPAA